MPAEPQPKHNDRVNTVSVVLIVVGLLNLVVFVRTYSAMRRASDFEGLPAEFAAITCLVFSGVLYMAGMMCVGQAVRNKQPLGRSIMGMVAGASALIALFVIKFFRL